MSDPVVTTAVSENGAPATSGTRPSSDAERQRVKQLAQEFEALLMTQMLREMRRAMLSDEEPETGFGSETMTDMVDVELGRALSGAGGFGLSSMLFKAIEQRLKDTTPRTPSVVPTSRVPCLLPADPQPISLEPASEPGQATSSTDGSDLVIPNGRVSSAFGWRRDPFTGRPRFHRGIDVAQAYGQDVRAAAAGRVVFAGDQGAYGTMIVIDHPGGRQTRYAHLAVSGVQPGDRVDVGEVIGKSGNSGHSTGPHLHFEVLEAGRAVDPGAGS
jgi:murein DD-endopeptidase MepM/ murein hydrolase activator NlpD